MSRGGRRAHRAQRRASRLPRSFVRFGREWAWGTQPTKYLHEVHALPLVVLDKGAAVGKSEEQVVTIEEADFECGGHRFIVSIDPQYCSLRISTLASGGIEAQSLMGKLAEVISRRILQEMGERLDREMIHGPGR